MRAMLLSDLMSSPEFYPTEIDLVNRQISFARMSKQDYRLASFDDQHASRRDLQVFVMNLDDLLFQHMNATATKAKPTHYLLHVAFCCSTLLCRYLELLPRCFVLKEPSVLAQATIGYRPFSAIPDLASGGGPLQEWLLTLGLCTTLLGRTYSPDDIVIIKPSDLCNLIGDALLFQDARTRVVTLSTNLPTYLLSVLKYDQRRSLVRRRLDVAKRNAAVFPGLSSIDFPSLSDAEAAACLWIYYNSIFLNLSRKWGRRIVSFTGDDVADRPVETLGTITDLVGLPIDDGVVQRVISDPSVTSRHSKDLSREYNADTRRAELLQLKKSFGAEAEKGTEWALRYTQSTACDQQLGQAVYQSTLDG
jgi:hypothetical protein